MVGKRASVPAGAGQGQAWQIRFVYLFALSEYSHVLPMPHLTSREPHPHLGDHRVDRLRLSLNLRPPLCRRSLRSCTCSCARSALRLNRSRRRHRALRNRRAEDPSEISEWAPLRSERRQPQAQRLRSTVHLVQQSRTCPAGVDQAETFDHVTQPSNVNPASSKPRHPRNEPRGEPLNLDRARASDGVSPLLDIRSSPPRSGGIERARMRAR